MKLKQCPFCGYDDIYLGHAHATGFHAKCFNCGAQTMAFSYPEYDPKARGFTWWDKRLKSDAAHAWNRRVE